MSDYNLQIGINANKAVSGANKATQSADKVTKSFTKASGAVNKQENSLNRLQSAYLAVGKVMGVYFTGKILVGMVRGLTQVNDMLAKKSQQLGITTEDLSVLSYQAELAGANFETSVLAVQMLSRSMFQASKGISEQSRAFESMGITVREQDGSLRNSQEVMLDIADAFSKMRDGAGKTAVSMVLFGRGGSTMIPMLNEGRKGLEATAEDAKNLGIVLDTDLSKGAEILNDNIFRVIESGTAFKNILANDLVPSINVFTESMIQGGDSLERMKAASEVAGIALNSILTVFHAVKATINEALTSVESFSGAMVAIGRGEFSMAVDIIKEEFAEIGETNEQLNKDVSDTWTATTEKMVADANKLKTNMKTGDIELPTAKATEDIDKFFNHVEDGSESMSNKILEGIQNFDDSFSGTLNDMVWSADRSFGNVLESFGKMLTKMIIQATIAQPILQAVTGFAGSFMPENMSGQSSTPMGTTASGASVPLPPVRPHANGGLITEPVMGRGTRSGSPYIFAENGIERISPVSGGGGGGGSVQVNISNESGQDVKATSSTASNSGAGDMVINIVLDAIQNNKGGLREVIGGA